MISKLITIIIIATIIRILMVFFRGKKYSKEGTLGNLASTIGVLGTFIGISIGLYGFDPNNITDSVPQLLDGMKIAFYTSVAGMTASILMKSIALKNESEEEDIDDIVQLFNTMIRESRNLNETLKENQEQTQIIFKSMSEVWNINQKELISEIKDLNNKTICKQEELISEFRLFGKEMAQNNTDALIEALNDVIRDFNNNLTEQFGENFKELNYAVAALLVWQENYKDIIQVTTDQLNQTVDSIKDIDNSIQKIGDNSILIRENNEHLNTILGYIDDSQNKIKIGLDSLIEVSNKATESIPNIDRYFENSNEHIRNTIDNLENMADKNLNIVEDYIGKLAIDVSEVSSNSIEEVKHTIIKSSDAFADEAKGYIANFEYVTNQLRDCIPEINEHLLKTQERFNNTLSTFTTEIKNALNINMESIKNQSEIMKNSVNDINKNLNSTINDSTKRLEDITVNTSAQITHIVENMEDVFEQKVDQLDQLLEVELTKALNSLAGQLVTISDRFSKDYIPLADKLKEVVKIAERVR